jgi:hypothetical protein
MSRIYLEESYHVNYISMKVFGMRKEEDKNARLI